MYLVHCGSGTLCRERIVKLSAELPGCRWTTQCS